jgi:hypothetical protein
MKLSVTLKMFNVMLPSDTEGEAIEVVEIGAHNGIEVLQGVDHHQGTLSTLFLHNIVF